MMLQSAGMSETGCTDPGFKFWIRVGIFLQSGSGHTELRSQFLIYALESLQNQGMLLKFAAQHKYVCVCDDCILVSHDGD